MSRIVGREVRKRGLFGWLFLLIFFAFNGLMLLWFVSYWKIISGSETFSAGSQAERAGAPIGAGLGTSFILFIWVAGAVITGLFALLTRGRKVYVEDFGDLRIEKREDPR